MIARTPPTGGHSGSAGANRGQPPVRRGPLRTDTLRGMCRRMTCRNCGLASGKGCGAHVDQVLGDVPPGERCQCDPNTPRVTFRPALARHPLGDPVVPCHHTYSLWGSHRHAAWDLNRPKNHSGQPDPATWPPAHGPRALLPLALGRCSDSTKDQRGGACPEGDEQPLIHAYERGQK